MLIFWRYSQQGPAGSAVSTARRGLTQPAGCFPEHHLQNAGLSWWRAGLWFFSGFVDLVSNVCSPAAPCHCAGVSGKEAQ